MDLRKLSRIFDSQSFEMDGFFIKVNGRAPQAVLKDSLKFIIDAIKPYKKFLTDSDGVALVEIEVDLDYKREVYVKCNLKSSLDYEEYKPLISSIKKTNPQYDFVTNDGYSLRMTYDLPEELMKYADKKWWE